MAISPTLASSFSNLVSSGMGQLAMAAAVSMCLAGLGAVIHASTTARKIAQVFADVAALAKPLIDQAAASKAPVVVQVAALEQQAVQALAADGVNGDASRILSQDLPEVAAAIAEAVKPLPPSSAPATPKT